MATKEIDVPLAAHENEQCNYKTEKGRRCKLKVNGEGKHPGQHRIVIRKTDKPALPAGLVVKTQDIPKDAVVTKTMQRTAAPRDADQKKFDNDVIAAYQKWVNSGRPVTADSDTFKKAGKRYVIPPSAVDAVLYYLRNAVGAGAPMAGKRFIYRRGTDHNGIVINFMITDPPAKKL
jgi:hypothetical protein